MTEELIKDQTDSRLDKKWTQTLLLTREPNSLKLLHLEIVIFQSVYENLWTCQMNVWTGFTGHAVKMCVFLPVLQPCSYRMMSYKGEWWGPAAATGCPNRTAAPHDRAKINIFPSADLTWMCAGELQECVVCTRHMCTSSIFVHVYLCICLCAFASLHNQLGQSETHRLLNYIFIFLHFFPLSLLNGQKRLRPTPSHMWAAGASSARTASTNNTSSTVQWPHLCRSLQCTLCSLIFTKWMTQASTVSYLLKERTDQRLHNNLRKYERGDLIYSTV